MSRISSDPGSGVSTFDSAVNEPVRSASWGSSTFVDRNKNDGVDEGASDDDFDDEADLTSK